MERDTEQTPVIFRVFKDGGDVVALFPEFVNYPDGCVESYQRMGQHGAANYSHCMKVSRPATANESAALKRELESIGYNLKVQTRSKFVPGRA
jgi:hypothetical protein